MVSQYIFRKLKLGRTQGWFGWFGRTNAVSVEKLEKASGKTLLTICYILSLKRMALERAKRDSRK